MMYTGTVVEESLLDNRIINDLQVESVHISQAEASIDRWHLYKVQVTSEQIDILAQGLKPSGWYTHFWNNDDVVVVFPNKKFNLKYSEKNTWDNAVSYGKSIGIPEEQLDFPIDGS